ncbi:MAG TPA: tetratricopeptide repeat protein [Pyrinomonadaceae bacterium]|nr:tetratricopeptide repeat protein [Pyrinomonadaceae bacterium]
MSQRLAKLITPVAAFAIALALICGCTGAVRAQTDDVFGDGSADPVKLFERGQNAHARNDLIKALEFYEEAIKVRPEFAEAEFQRGNVLVGLARYQEAESAFRRTLELKKDWALPYSAYGALLVRLNRDSDAEPILRDAIRLDGQNNVALRLLADIRLRAGDTKQAVELARRATNDKEASASTWILRALAERAAGDKVAAVASLDHVLQLEPNNFSALMERAEIRITAGDNEGAVADLKTAEPLAGGDTTRLSRLAADYDLAGKPHEAERIAKVAGLSRPSQPSENGGLKVVGTPEEIEAANSDDPETARKALEGLLVKNPDNALLLSRLGAAYRTVDPQRSLDFYKRAATIEPANADYATGYSSALVQARRFAEAASILRRVISTAPDNYVAHANLATALYELKQFAPALEEYGWLIKTKPDLTVAYYFIATAHDYLGEYPEALEAYEAFLVRADAKTNQLEIEKVKLRLPSLRRQIQLGQGTKRKTGRGKQ